MFDSSNTSYLSILQYKPQKTRQDAAETFAKNIFLEKSMTDFFPSVFLHPLPPPLLILDPVTLELHLVRLLNPRYWWCWFFARLKWKLKVCDTKTIQKMIQTWYKTKTIPTKYKRKWFWDDTWEQKRNWDDTKQKR